MVAAVTVLIFSVNSTLSAIHIGGNAVDRYRAAVFRNSFNPDEQRFFGFDAVVVIEYGTLTEIGDFDHDSQCPVFLCGKLRFL